MTQMLYYYSWTRKTTPKKNYNDTCGDRRGYVKKKKLISVTNVVRDHLDDQTWAQFGYLKKNRQMAEKVKLHVVFTTTLIPLADFNLYPIHVVESQDKTLYNDYFSLEALNKQHSVHCTRI